MADSSSVDVILEFLRRNKFAKAEAALRGELGNRPDLNGILQKLILDDKESGNRSSEEVNGGIIGEDENKKSTRHSGEVLKDSSTLCNAEANKELIVKEVECGTGTNGSENKWKSSGTIGQQSKVIENVGASDKKFTFSNGLDDTVLDLYSWKYHKSITPVDIYRNDVGNNAENNALGPGKAKLKASETLDGGLVNHNTGQDASFSCEKKVSWTGSVSNTRVKLTHVKTEPEDVDQLRMSSSICPKDDLVDNLWTRSDVSAHPSSELRKECSVKTVFPSSIGDTSTSYDSVIAGVDKKEGKKRAEVNSIRAAIKGQVDDVGRALFFGNNQGGDPKDFGPLDFHLVSENQKEELPRLPPVRLKSEDKSFNIQWEEKYERDESSPKILNSDNAYLIGSFLDVPIGQEINPSGFPKYLKCSCYSFQFIF